MNIRENLTDLFFLLRFKIDNNFLIRILMPAIVAFILTTFIFSLNIAQFLPQLPYWFVDSNLWPFPMWVIKLAVWVFIFMVVVLTIDKIYEFKKRGKNYAFDCEKFYLDWIFNGRPTVISNPCTLRIRTTRAGCLLKKYLWRNFTMSFQMRFVDGLEKNVGIIFRAQSLEDYFMLEIIQTETAVYIKPHIREKGAWEIMLKEKISRPIFGRFTQVMLSVYNEKITLDLAGENQFEWHLPTHVDINHVEEGTSRSGSSPNDELNKAENIIPKIYFRKSYGMIGFRAHLFQGAEIRGLTIQAI